MAAAKRTTTPTTTSPAEDELDRVIAARLSAMQRDEYLRAYTEGGEPALRELAQERLQHGSYLVMAAFNLTNDPAVPYEFDEEVQFAVREAMVTLIRLMRRPMRCTIERVAAKDPAVERFMQTVMQPPSRRRSRAVGGRRG